MSTNGHNRVYTAVVEYDAESKMYIGSVVGIRGAHTQAATLDELQVNLKEVIALCMEEFHLDEEEIPRFIGLQQIELSA